MFTIIESPLFSRLWPGYRTEAERGDFVAYLAANPEAGELIAGSGGCRKVRWPLRGVGKSARDTIPAHILRKRAEELGPGDQERH